MHETIVRGTLNAWLPDMVQGGFMVEFYFYCFHSALRSTEIIEVLG
jgi:hypothetical protein